MKTDTILVRSVNFVQRQLGDETVLVPISQTGVDVQNIYTLNETAAIVWELLENKCTEDDIIAAAEERYDASIGVIKKDIQKLIAEFIQESFVNVVKV